MSNDKQKVFPGGKDRKYGGRSDKSDQQSSQRNENANESTHETQDPKDRLRKSKKTLWNTENKPREPGVSGEVEPDIRGVPQSSQSGAGTMRDPGFKLNFRLTGSNTSHSADPHISILSADGYTRDERKAPGERCDSKHSNMNKASKASAGQRRNIQYKGSSNSMEGSMQKESNSNKHAFDKEGSKVAMGHKSVYPRKETRSNSLLFDLTPSLAGKILFNKHRVQQLAENVLEHKRVIVLYFGASWSESCRKWPRLLNKLQKVATKNEISLEIIFISSDNSDDEFWNDFKKSHGDWWAAPPKSDLSIMLRYEYGVTAIPYIIPIRRNGEVISRTGIQDLEKMDKDGTLRGWK